MILEKIKYNIVDKINQSLGKDLVDVKDLVYPPEVKMGDISLPCFDLAKKLGKSPNDVAKELFEIEFDDIETAVLGPYLNITVKIIDLAQQLENIDKDYGQNVGGKDQRVMVEYSNVNTHKEYHVGHLRNIAFGDSVVRLLSANGYDAMPVSYVNDFGINVAKTLWGWKKDEPGTAVRENEDKGYLLGQTYVKAVKDLEGNEVGKEEVSQLMKNIESKQGSDYELWQKTRQWSIDYFHSVYEKLGNEELKIVFDHEYYESEYIDAGKKLVEELKTKDILIESQGAVIADLEQYDLGILVVIRSDGTALYPVADLALAQAKFEQKINRSIYVVDNRQSLYFKQIFKVLELMGYQEEMIHLPYDFVKLPTGMMSSRSGNTITFKDLYEQVYNKLLTETLSRHDDWKKDDEKVVRIIRTLTVGVLKFEMLKVSASKIIVFDVDKALSLAGYTSIYIQYTAARINSIIRRNIEEGKKDKVIDDNVDYSQLQHPLEKQLLLALAKFPDVVALAGDNYEPSMIAKYLFDLAQLNNEYYHEVPVFKAEEAVKQARVALLSGVRQVFENGFKLLGIDIVEEM